MHQLWSKCITNPRLYSDLLSILSRVSRVIQPPLASCASWPMLPPQSAELLHLIGQRSTISHYNRWNRIGASSLVALHPFLLRQNSMWNVCSFLVKYWGVAQHLTAVIGPQDPLNTFLFTSLGHCCFRPLLPATTLPSRQSQTQSNQSPIKEGAGKSGTNNNLAKQECTAVA